MTESRKVAAIFSGTRPPGLGREVALQMAERGYDVAIVDHCTTAATLSSNAGDRVALESIAAEIALIGRHSCGIDMDFLQPGGAEKGVAAVVERLGRLDVACILTGGTGPAIGNGLLTDVTDEAFGRAVGLNLTGPFLIAKACARRLIEQGGGGSIVFQSSHAAIIPTPRTGAFGAARAGLNFLVRIFAIELGPHGIRINAVCPFAIAPGGDATKNPGLVHFLQNMGKNLDSLGRDIIPLGRAQSPAETASAITFLALDATFVTGESWTIAGGTQGFGGLEAFT